MFFGAKPLEELTNESHVNVAFLGVPVDSGLVKNSGVMHGPQKLREISMRYQNMGDGYYDMYQQKFLLKRNAFWDAGDIKKGSDYKGTLENAVKSIVRIVKQGMFPVVIGGDHSATIASLRVFNDTPLFLVYFDAHLDFNDLKSPYDLSSATVLRNVKKYNLAEEILILGTKGVPQKYA
jgi:agmatinase